MLVLLKFCCIEKQRHILYGFDGKCGIVNRHETILVENNKYKTAQHRAAAKTANHKPNEHCLHSIFITILHDIKIIRYIIILN